MIWRFSDYFANLVCWDFMSGQGRLGDKANIPADTHGCPGCPHPGTGPAIQGSANVLVNGRPALRVADVGIHAACCGANMWQAQKGAPTVFINSKAAFRLNDATKHCGGQGNLIEGSSDVLVGDSAGGGGGGGGGGGAASSAAAAGSAETVQPSPGADPHEKADPAVDGDPAHVDAVAQAATLKAAAASGVPFCEECDRRRKAKLAA